jgi:hypothetical protein
MPQGDSEGRELGLARAGTLIFIPPKAGSLIKPSISPIKPKALIEIKTREAVLWRFGALTIWPPRCNTASRHAITLLQLIEGQKLDRGSVIDYRALIQPQAGSAIPSASSTFGSTGGTVVPCAFMARKHCEHFVDQHRHDAFRAAHSCDAT